LNIVLAVENLPDGVRLGSVWIPHVDSEHQRVAAWVVVEYRLDRRVGDNSSVPIKFAVDAHRRKGRRQRARCHYMADRELRIAHFTGLDVCRANREPCRASVNRWKTHEIRQGFFERMSRIMARCVNWQRNMLFEKCQGIWFEESRYSSRHCHPIRPGAADTPNTRGDLERRIVYNAVPKCLELRQSVFLFVASDQARVDGADRCADDPIWFNPGFMQGLIHARLSAMRAARDAPRFELIACVSGWSWYYLSTVLDENSVKEYFVKSPMQSNGRSAE
jgi:hypothetical protein